MTSDFLKEAARRSPVRTNQVMATPKSVNPNGYVSTVLRDGGVHKSPKDSVGGFRTSSTTPQVVNYSSAVTPTAINQQDRLLIKQAEEERKAQKTPTAINREDSQKIKAAEAEKPSQQAQAATPKQGTSTGSNGYVSTAPLREAETTPAQTEKVSQPTPGLIGFGSIGPAPIVTDTTQYDFSKLHEISADSPAGIAINAARKEMERTKADLAQAEKDSAAAIHAARVAEGRKPGAYLTGSLPVTTTPYAAGLQAKAQETDTTPEAVAAARTSAELAQIRKQAQQAEKVYQLTDYATLTTRDDYGKLARADEDKATFRFGGIPAGKGGAYAFINDINGARQNQRESAVTAGAAYEYGEYERYTYMTPDEIGLYNAIVKTRGLEEGGEFLRLMEEELNRRQGTADYENLPSVGKALYWAPAGLDQFAGGVASLFSEEARANSPTQFTSAMVRQDAEDIHPALGVAYDLGTTVTNMVPSILASSVIGAVNPMAGAVTGNVLMGASAAGNAYNQKLKEGYTPDQARAYGTMVGVSEATLQYMLGGIGKLGGLDTSALTAKIAKIDNGLARAALTLGVHVAPEALEEGLQEILEPAFATILFGEDYDLDPEAVIYSALMGALTSGVFSAPDVYQSGRGTVQAQAETGQYRATKPQNVDMPTVPIIDLSTQDIPTEGGELPAVGNSLRTDAIERARKRLGLDENSTAYIPASNVTRDGNEYVLKITRSSLNKMLSPANQGIIPVESIVVLDNLERIANNGVWFDGQGDRRSRQQIAGIDHLKTTVYIDSVPYVVDMRVRLVEEVPGKGIDNVLYYFTPEEILTIERVDTVSPTDERRALIGESEMVSTLGDSIPQPDPAVKPGEAATERSGPMSRQELTDQILSRALPLPQGSGDGQMERVVREGVQKGLTKLARTSEGKLALFNLALWKGDGFGKAFDDAIVDWVVWSTPDSPTEGSDHLADALYTTLVDYFQNKLAGDKAVTKPDEAKTKLTRSDDGSTIGERKDREPTIITDGIIQRVPLIELPDYSADECAALQQQHKELLKHARDENEGKEVAFVFRPGLTDRRMFLGTDDSLDFGQGLSGTDLIVMHNHPRNGSFSDQDITFFLRHDGVRCLTIVKHDGSVEAIIKTSKYDRRSAVVELDRLHRKYVKTGSNQEISKAIYEFIRKGKGGLAWMKTTGF